MKRGSDQIHGSYEFQCNLDFLLSYINSELVSICLSVAFVIRANREIYEPSQLTSPVQKYSVTVHHRAIPVKSKRGVLRMYVFKKISGIFRFVTLPLLGNFGQNKGSSKFQDQKPKPQKFRMIFFLITFGNPTFFQLPLEFPHAAPGNSMTSSYPPPVWIFSGIAHSCMLLFAIILFEAIHSSCT